MTDEGERLPWVHETGEGGRVEREGGAEVLERGSGRKRGKVWKGGGEGHGIRLGPQLGGKG